MGELRINTIIKENSLLQFYYTVSEDIKKYFRDTPFKIEYPESVDQFETTCFFRYYRSFGF